MPPMQYISLLELVTRREQDLLASQVRTGWQEGKHILQLIAKAIGATRLIRAGTTPDPAGQRLVGQPAVEQEVQGRIRRLHAHHSEQIIPEVTDAHPGGLNLRGVMEVFEDRERGL